MFRNRFYHQGADNILQMRAPVITTPSSTRMTHAVEVRGCIATGVLFAVHAPTILSLVAMVPPLSNSPQDNTAPLYKRGTFTRVFEAHTTLAALCGTLAAFPPTDYDLVTACIILHVPYALRRKTSTQPQGPTHNYLWARSAPGGELQ
jgi:hypothetical protein